MNPEMKSMPEESITATMEPLVPLFEVFVDQKFGDKVWDHLLTNNTFIKLIIEYFPIYGDAVFKDVVDMTAEYTNTPVFRLLEEFSDFIETYY